jgi:O-methyltransferase involved in polyketide biosynthesis
MPRPWTETMQFIAKNSPPGSELVFDYIPTTSPVVIFPKCHGPASRPFAWPSYGHPWKFGIARASR